MPFPLHYTNLLQLFESIIKGSNGNTSFSNNFLNAEVNANP